jgi:hypothetical protein
MTDNGHSCGSDALANLEDGLAQALEGSLVADVATPMTES